MKKLLNLGVVLTSLLGYLEWGKEHHAFLVEAEVELFQNSNQASESFLHPMILLPLCGQLIMVFTLFQKQPGRLLSLIGLACLSVLMLMLFLIGALILNPKILVSTIPFLMLGFFVVRLNRKAV